MQEIDWSSVIGTIVLAHGAAFIATVWAAWRHSLKMAVEYANILRDIKENSKDTDDLKTIITKLSRDMDAAHAKIRALER